MSRPKRERRIWAQNYKSMAPPPPPGFELRSFDETRREIVYTDDIGNRFILNADKDLVPQYTEEAGKFWLAWAPDLEGLAKSFEGVDKVKYRNTEGKAGTLLYTIDSRTNMHIPVMMANLVKVDPQKDQVLISVAIGNIEYPVASLSYKDRWVITAASNLPADVIITTYGGVYRRVNGVETDRGVKVPFTGQSYKIIDGFTPTSTSATGLIEELKTLHSKAQNSNQLPQAKLPMASLVASLFNDAFFSPLVAKFKSKEGNTVTLKFQVKPKFNTSDSVSVEAKLRLIKRAADLTYDDAFTYAHYNAICYWLYKNEPTATKIFMDTKPGLDTLDNTWRVQEQESFEDLTLIAKVTRIRTVNSNNVNLQAYVDFSDTGTWYGKGRAYMVTSRAVRAGDELFLDYGDADVGSTSFS